MRGIISVMDERKCADCGTELSEGNTVVINRYKATDFICKPCFEVVLKPQGKFFGIS